MKVIPRFNPKRPYTGLQHRSNVVPSKLADPTLSFTRDDDLQELTITDIQVGEPSIPIKVGDVEKLRQSIAASHQHTPILVRELTDGSYILLDGWGRVEALRSMEKVTVKARVLKNLSNEDARLHQLVSNQRKTLTVMDRANQDHEFLTIMRSKVPQDAAPSPGGRQPSDKCHRKAAKALGTSADRIARAERISTITPSVQTRVRELGLANNQTALLKIAKAGGTADAQLAMLEVLQAKLPKVQTASTPKVATIETSSLSQTELSISSHQNTAPAVEAGVGPAVTGVPANPLPLKTTATFDEAKSEWDRLVQLTKLLSAPDLERFHTECLGWRAREPA